MSLPSGYTKLQWIESTGTQWADTGVCAKGSQTKVVADVEITYGSSWTMILGSFNSGAYFSWWTNGSALLPYYGSTHQQDTGMVGRGTLTADKAVWSYGDTSMTFSESTFTATSTMYLFSVNAGGDYASASMKLYSCKIYDGSTLVRDFIPCKNASGTVGLWDDVGSQFYGNAGTGSFIAGPVALEPPTAPTNFQSVLAVVLSWTAAERAESYKLYRDGTLLGTTTATQWVDTTVEPNETYVYSIKAVNAAGESAAAEVTVYTKAGYFEYKPVITDANFQ